MNPKQKENEEQQETIETKIAYWLNYVSYDLFEKENPQAHLFDAILTIQDDYCGDDKTAHITKEFLKSVLKLTFILKDNQEEIKKFVKYHSDRRIPKKRFKLKLGHGCNIG